MLNYLIGFLQDLAEGLEALASGLEMIRDIAKIYPADEDVT